MVKVMTKEKSTTAQESTVNEFAHLVMYREDPRKLTKKIKRHDLPYQGNQSPYNTPGRVAITTMIYRTRVHALDLSLQKFAALLTEDCIRDLILHGTSVEEAENIKKMVATTIRHIEANIGAHGMYLETMQIIHPRIADPRTGNAFNILDFQGVLQDYIPVDLDFIQSQAYIEMAIEVNKQVDKELFYTAK